MSQVTPSRATLADVISAVSQANLSDLQRRDQISAVRTVARLLGTSPEAILLDIPMLRKRLEALSPETAGVSPGRWANIRSLFGRALSQARPLQPSRSLAPMLPAWEVLLQSLDRNQATRLKPFLRHLSAQGVEPTTVTLADLEAYGEAVLNNRLRHHPERTWDGLIWVWNACARDVPGWPAVQIPRTTRRETYVLPWSHFPAALKADVDAFLIWRGELNLADDAPARPARAGTLKHREYQLRVAASALVHKGYPVAELISLRALVTLENILSVLDFLLDRHDRKPTPSVSHIAVFLKYVADKYLQLDELQIVRIKKLISKVVSNKRGMTRKNRGRLRPFDDPVTVQAFLDLPRRIRALMEKDRRAAKTKAVLAQTAAAIAILQVAPLRIGNLASIDLRKHLIQRGERVNVVFSEEETKNGVPIDFELHAHALDILAWYVKDHRPALLKGATNALFPGETGGSKSSTLLGSQISRTIRQHLNLEVHAHLFRHIAAKLYLDRNPGQYEVMRQVLRHNSIETTTAFYAGAETRSATAHFASVINDIRLDSKVAKDSNRARRSTIKRVLP